MRKCKFSTMVKAENNGWVKKEQYGLFHRWGLDMEEYESGGVNWTVGIVETSDGQIHSTSPSSIQFLPLGFSRKEFEDFAYLGHNNLGGCSDEHIRRYYQQESK